MDFYQIRVKEGKKEEPPEIYPDFTVGRSKDLMVRGGAFYAIWDEARGLWSTDEYDVQRLVDEDLRRYAKELSMKTGAQYLVRDLRSFSSNSWNQFRKFIKNISDNSHQLDETLTFANQEVKKSDYVSRRLPYPLVAGDCDAWDELVGTLYSVEERAKIEWMIGAVVSGDSKKIQKFGVFYGPPGSGKGTIINVVMKLFEGYLTAFDARALGSSGATFATEVFKHNPLVAIQHDGDLSRIEDNARLNSIISHEDMPMNEKYKAGYTARVNAFLFMGTNKPVKISDAKSGIIRRLIDIHPTGVRIPTNHYHTLMSKIDFELGAVAHRCLQVYRDMGINYYNNYRPLEMMLQTDVFFNFIEANFDVFKQQDGTSLKQAYTLYKEFCSDTGIERVLPQYKVREELRNYFDDFKDRATIDGVIHRSWYTGFNANKFKTPAKDANAFSLVIEETESLLDDVLAAMPAQYHRVDDDGFEVPAKKWVNVKTVLSDLDTHNLHFVRVPENHLVIDFDLKDQDGAKSLERNLEAASNWPPTYAELSKGGNGVHLHYIYNGGDIAELASQYSEGIEVKTLLGDASLRRRLTKCNNIPIATFTGALPKKEKKVLSDRTIKSEKGLRDLILKNMRKEIHPGTKPSIDFIKHILDEQYESGMPYNVSDMKSRLLAFANSSTNHAVYCLKVVQQMKLEGQEQHASTAIEAKDERIVIFDVEVYPNLFVVCWKFRGAPKETIVRMINPSPQEIEQLFKLKLMGFYNRRYDNHILYAAFLGYDNQALFELSQKIVSNHRGAMFGEAYNLSYGDIWDISSKKQTLKLFQIELGLPHVEMNIPWDEPVPEDMVEKVVDYCCNDVETTDEVLSSRWQDFVARQILAELSGLTVNDTTQKHTAKIIFGDDKNPQKKFVYTDLSKEFPGYEFDRGKSSYRGEDPGEGGYVYAEPGIYENVVLLDVASMHPTSIEQLDLFGEYTPRFSAIKSARLAIKHKDYETAGRMLEGKLKPFLENPESAGALSDALKLAINTVYGLTAASFDNPFRDPRNIDNIVAKRGALFMIDLKHSAQEKGLTVAHIKTDSIKIPNATDQDIDDVMNFGDKYGYTFEHEATYEKMCLVNDAVYVARINGEWHATGAQFQHPYVFKKLFSGDMIEFGDMCETKQVNKGAMYLDFEYDRPMPVVEAMQFVGKTGRFVPVREGCGGAVLYRVKDDKLFAVTGTKGYLWREAATVSDPDMIDMTYFDHLIDAAYKTIEKFGDFETFVS